MSSRDRRLSQVASVLLAALVGIQLLVLARTYAYPWLGRIWHYRFAPAMARSLLFGEGYYYASDSDDLELVEFIRANVPEDGLLVLPSRVGRGKFTESNYMQYFLYPRRIESCSREWTFDQCFRLMIGEEGFLLRTGGFPDVEEPQGRMRYIPWNEESGLYVPLDGRSG